MPTSPNATRALVASVAATVAATAAAAAALAAVALVGCAPEGDLAPSRFDPASLDRAGPAATPDVPGATASWSADVQAGIAAGEYAPEPDGERLVATNRAQDLRASFGLDGLAVTNRAGAGEIGLTLRAWGREGATTAVDATPPEEGPCLAGGAVDAFGACLRRVDYARPGLVEWWENRPEGLEQGFTVTAPPDGEGALVFELALTGAIADVEDGEALLVREGGDPLRYAKLAAWDERGRELPTWMEETEAGLRILVDDRGAIGVVTVDPLLTTAAWTAESDKILAFFGYSVASAGDVNGDGYGDVVVGAFYYDSSTDGGRAFLYFGSSSGLATSAGWVAEGDQVGAYFGWSVASAGDVNGDGYADVAVGADQYANGESFEGRVSVFHGSSTGLATSAAWTGESNQASGLFGYSVASAGDVNADGYGDLVVGAIGYSNGQSAEGRALLYLGSSVGLATTAAWTVESDQASAQLGCSVASAGDVNGDGYSDVVVGVSRYDGVSADEGRVYVYHGSASGLETSEAWRAESRQASGLLGSSVASAGDVNGDGYGDVVVGANQYDNGSTDEGQAYLYLGSHTGLARTAAWTAESDQDGASFGASVASAGDVNGDGYGDVVVGAPEYDNGSTAEGRAYLYLGSSAGLATTAAWTAESNQEAALFGGAVASAGDVDGDGYGDVVVGARGYSNGSAYEGRASVFRGSPSGLATSAAFQAESNQASASFGNAVASAGDVNGDGYGDVLVGASSYDGDPVNNGRVYLYPGTSTGLSTTVLWTAEAREENAFFGSAVASAGDVNGDGYGDIVIGAYLFGDDAYAEGKAYVYLGSASGPASGPAWTVEADQEYAYFGTSVGSAGDVNGDGYGDVVIGAPGYTNGSASEGRAFVYLGASTGLATIAAWTAESNQAGASFGQSVASAGDVNGDGYTDVVVGAHLYDNGATDEGRTSLYLGSALGLATSAAWTAESNQASASFGIAVASAGDVNGDGYGDVVVGASSYDNGSTDEGRASVYLGSASGLGTSATWTAESDQASASFGYAVASAGDVNGDGYGDVVVGAYLYDNGSTNEGRASVYLGSSSGLATTAGWTAESDQAAAYLGYAVASAGDVNGDGYGDLVVGAHKYDNGHTDEGIARVYMGNGADGTTPLARVAQSRQPGATTVIAPGLASSGAEEFDVAMVKARGAWGRGKVKLQVEAKRLGTAFTGTGLTTATSYTSSGLTGVALQQSITRVSHAAGYHWRVRVLASPAEGRPQGWGPWMYGGLSGSAVGGHVFTAGVTYAPDADGDRYGDSDHPVTVRGDAPSGYVMNTGDCDDGSATVHVDAAEIVGDDIDQDCDELLSCYENLDGDGYGSSRVILYPSCSLPGPGGASLSGDCDDRDARVSPDAAETIADGIDQDCDGVDACYTDADGDDYGSTVATDGSSLSCATGTGATVSTDCDDSRASAYPGAPEVVADGLDQDCDSVDSCYTDADADNYGTSVVSDGSSLDCVTGTGAAVATDCRDTNDGVYPGATEIVADGIDQDCDAVDACYTDADGDDYGTTVVSPGSSLDCVTGAGAAVATDCDDVVGWIHPGSTEEVADGVDQDCDRVDACYTDADGDNYGTTVLVDGSSLDCVAGTGAAVATDCDDAAATVHPDATERPGDAVDQDCDGAESCYADADGDGARSSGLVSAVDPACTGFGEALASADLDCDDADAAAFPAATDVTGSGVDEDCDGAEVCYVDADTDGYRPDGTSTVVSADGDCADVGEALATALAGDCDDASAAYNPAAAESDCTDPHDYNCDGATGYVDGDGDTFAACAECDDANADVHPGAAELPGDGVDADCDGFDRCYADADDDGFRTADLVAGTTVACDGAGEAAADADEDCDDGDASVNPAAVEAPGDGVDGDCDGAELCYADGDGDGYGTGAYVDSTDRGCDGSGEASAASDCDDDDDAIHPGAEETDCADPVDYNCDGATGYADADGDGYAACAECDDGDAAVNPVAAEVCNDADDDCDGAIDDDAGDVSTWYADADADGYTDPAVSSAACDAPDGYAAATEDDCDDADAARNPGGVDVPDDGIDQDCDGADAVGDTGAIDTGDTGAIDTGGDTGADTGASDTGDTGADTGDADTADTDLVDTDPPVDDTDVDADTDGEPEATACGCGSPGGPVGAWILALGAVLGTARRRAGR